MNDIVLSGRNISMRYGSRVVLDDISIDIRAGEVTALLSTLMARVRVRC